jgi:hypothetical protein
MNNDSVRKKVLREQERELEDRVEELNQQILLLDESISSSNRNENKINYNGNVNTSSYSNPYIADKENFETNVPANDELPEQVIGSKVTYPTAKNPFMNVLVDEIKYNPYRSKAASVYDPEVSVGLEDYFKTQFINDPTDVFGKSQSQRQFYTTPSTTVPNDVDSYQDWLYRIPGKTCKEGGRESCLPGSDGGVIPWLNINP